MLLDRRKVKFWQRMVFGFMAFLMAGFLVVGYSGVLNGCDFLNSTSSAVDELPEDHHPVPDGRRDRPPGRHVLAQAGRHLRADGQPAGRHGAQKTYWEKAIVAYKKADAILAEQKGTAVKQQRLEVLQSLASTYLYLNDYTSATAVYGDITSLHAEGRAVLLRHGDGGHQRRRHQHRAARVHQVPGAGPDFRGRRPGQGMDQAEHAEVHVDALSIADQVWGPVS